MSELFLRYADISDSKDIWEWRNDPQSVEMFKSRKIVSWSEHEKWFRSVFNKQNYILLIGEKKNYKIGIVRFDIKKGGTEVSINLNPKMRGFGLSKILLKKSCLKYFNIHDAPIFAEIRVMNEISDKIFKGIGFSKIKTANGFNKLVLRKF